MQTIAFTATSREDGLALSCLLTVPEGPAKGIVQVSHGMEEHKERYLELLSYLASFGFAGIVHDHRGHGASVRSPGDLGFFYDRHGRAIVEDILTVQLAGRERLTEELGPVAQTLPLVLFAHSMGSIAARSFIKAHDDTLSGLVLCGVPCANPAVGAGIALVDLLSKIRGERALSKLVSHMVFGSANDALDGDHPLRWLSANPDNVRAYVDDPLCGFGFTLNGYRNLLCQLRDAFDPKGWSILNPDLPLLMIAGADDPIIGGEKGFAHSREFLRERGYRHIDAKLYPGLRHEILNEVEREEVFADIRAFVANACAGTW